jgi:hypothetical protein
MTDLDELSRANAINEQQRRAAAAMAAGPAFRGRQLDTITAGFLWGLGFWLAGAVMFAAVVIFLFLLRHDLHSA